MILTNYWWLLIWLFLGGAVLNNLPKGRETIHGETAERWKPVCAVLMVLPYIIWAGCRLDNFGDTALYRRTFLNTEADLIQIPGLFLRDTKDPGFTAFMILAKLFLGNNDTLFFLIIAAFQILPVSLVFRRYTKDYWTCIFLFVVSTDYLSWTHNGIRQFIAVAMIFAGFHYIVEKRYLPMILLILLASQIHGSALLMIPIIFVVQGRAWNRKTVLMLAVTAVVILFIDRFTPVFNDLLQDTQYDDIMTNEIWTNDDGTNLFRVAVYSVPAVMALLGRKYIRAAEDPVMNICVNCSIVTMALYLVAAASSGIYIGRLPIYTTLPGYMALPWMIDRIFERRSAKLVKTIMYGAYLAFFYVQLHVTWGVI